MIQHLLKNLEALRQCDIEDLIKPGTDKTIVTDEFIKGRIDGYRTIVQYFEVLRESTKGFDADTQIDLEKILPTQ